MVFYFKHYSDISNALNYDWQNFQSRHAEKRADADYEVNLKVEREIEAILLHLENQGKKLEKIMERLENKE